MKTKAPKIDPVLMDDIKKVREAIERLEGRAGLAWMNSDQIPSPGYYWRKDVNDGELDVVWIYQESEYDGDLFLREFDVIEGQPIQDFEKYWVFLPICRPTP